MSPLETELHTVEVIIESNAATRLTDALTLLWVKNEKQLRKLFVFIAYQSSNLRRLTPVLISDAVAHHGRLYSRHFIKGIDEIYYKPFRDVFGAEYTRLHAEMQRIRRTVRNKILHGQNTGLNLQESNLEKEIAILREWISCVYYGFKSEIAFGGFERKTFQKSKSVDFRHRLRIQFTSVADFSAYLQSL